MASRDFLRHKRFCKVFEIQISRIELALSDSVNKSSSATKLKGTHENATANRPETNSARR
jgi:hypothetical protein